MKLLLFMGVLTTIAFLSVAVGAAGESRESAARHKIQGDYDRFTRAESLRQYEMVKKATDAFCAPAFVLKLTPSRSFTHAQFLQEMKATCQEIRTVSRNEFRPQMLARRGNTIAENGVYVFAGTQVDADGEYGPVGKVHRFAETRTYQSIWTRASGQWKLQSMQILTVKRIVDGKPRG